MESFKFDLPERPSMNLFGEIISTEVIANHYDIKGVVDRRYKTGYRVMPSKGINIMLQFVIKFDTRFSMGQTWQIGDYGNYMITTITRDCAYFIPVRIFQNKGASINIFTKVPMFFCGYTIGEGSSYSKPKF